MNCSAITSCSNPKISKMGEEFFCFKCYQSFKKDENDQPKQVNIYQCCENPNIQFGDQNNFCFNC